MLRLSDEDHVKVSAAIAMAERQTDGEIVAVATDLSDSYHDVALHWAIAVLILVLAWAAWRPTALTWWYDLLFGGWSPEPTMSELLTFVMVLAVLKFTVVLLILRYTRPSRGGSAAGPSPSSRRLRSGAPSAAPASSSISQWVSGARRSSATRPSPR